MVHQELSFTPGAPKHVQHSFFSILESTTSWMIDFSGTFWCGRFDGTLLSGLRPISMSKVQTKPRCSQKLGADKKRSSGQTQLRGVSQCHQPSFVHQSHTDGLQHPGARGREGLLDQHGQQQCTGGQCGGDVGLDDLRPRQEKFRPRLKKQTTGFLENVMASSRNANDSVNYLCNFCIATCY